MYSIKVENPLPQFPQLNVSKRDPNLLGFVFSLSWAPPSVLPSSGLSSASGLESRLVLDLLSDSSLSAFSFLLVLGVLALGPSRLVIPNSAR